LEQLTLIGLIFDLIGVSLLGFDLLRVQTRLRKGASDRLKAFSEYLEEFESIGYWAVEREKGVRRIHLHEYWDYEAIDEDTKNIDVILERSRATESGLNELSEASRGLTNYLLKGADLDAQDAKTSLGVSYLGLILIVMGFSLQIIALL
jgi:hypothetical protein